MGTGLLLFYQGDITMKAITKDTITWHALAVLADKHHEFALQYTPGIGDDAMYARAHEETERILRDAERKVYTLWNK